MQLISRFPYLSLQQALLIMRVAVAVFFMAHAAVRLASGTIPQFASFLGSKGWPAPLLIVYLITAYELIAGTLMALGRWVRWCAAGLFFIAFMGIVIIHAARGWFVGEHGTGGMEYSLCLMVALSVLAAADRVASEKP
jgi:putative oxidoreductase